MNKLNNRECAVFFAAHNHYLILTHRNPDGDTIGSAGALCEALRAMGKEAYLYANPQFTEKQLRYVGALLAAEGFEPDTIVAADIASENQLPQGFSGTVNLCVDHHPSNTFYAEATNVNPEKAACAEILFEICKELPITVNKRIAELLYIGLSTDTGCFQYGNTNAAAFRAAAELVELGADNFALNEVFFRKITRARMKLEGLIYNAMRFYADGAVAVAVVTQRMLEETGATKDDCDDLAALAGKAEGARLCVTIKETESGGSKLSLRSGHEINSSEICAHFGGGGHAMAAGCSMECAPDEARERLMKVVMEVL